MPTLVNNLRAIRGPVTAVPVTAGSGIEIAADTQNNQIVISANLEAGSGIEIVDDNGKAKIINSDNAQALPIVAGTGVKLSVVNNQVVVSADETVLFENASGVNEDAGFTISEPFSNFERIRYIGWTNSCYFSIEVPVFNGIASEFRFGVTCMCYDSDGAPLQLYGKSFTSNNGLTYAASRSTVRWFDFNNTSAVAGLSSFWGKLYKIVGINRLSN